MNLKKYIKEVDNYPKEGISFKDITSLIVNPDVYKYTIDEIVKFGQEVQADIIVGPDARGFIVGCPVAYAMHKGFIPVRKKDKLPRTVIEESYDLEYGSNVLTIHKEDVKPGDKVLITDDLLATGGTIDATIKLLERLGAEVVGIAFIIELKDLNGREKIKNYNIKVLESY